MKKTVLPALLACAASVLASGCAHFTPPNERPVIEEKINPSFTQSAEVGTLVLSPDRRVVLANFVNHRFCAEAPTEVGADTSRLLSASAKGEAKDVQAALSMITANTLSNAVLNKRTQGMQLLQTSGYFLCQMYMNQAIEPADLKLLYVETVKTAAHLIEVEIKNPIKPDAATKAAIDALDVNKLAQDALSGQSGEDKDSDDKSGDDSSGDKKE